MTIWGIGWKIIFAALGYAVPAIALTLAQPEVFAAKVLPPGLSVGIGAALILCGVTLLALAGRAILPAFSRGELLTTGIYGLVRHPLYSAWILLIVPGAVFILQWWLLLGTSLVAYACFKLTIGKERRYLIERFGERYLAYERSVNEIVPWPRRFLRE